MFEKSVSAQFRAAEKTKTAQAEQARLRR